MALNHLTTRCSRCHGESVNHSISPFGVSHFSPTLLEFLSPVMYTICRNLKQSYYIYIVQPSHLISCLYSLYNIMYDIYLVVLYSADERLL